MSIRRAARPGTTVEVTLGTYDWTPDMQVLPHDPRVKIEITGPAGEPILTPPPYWFGKKAGQAQPPLPREVPARITIPADVPPGDNPLASGQRQRRASVLRPPKLEERKRRSHSERNNYRGARLARMRCRVRRCMFSRRAVSETLRLHIS